MAYKTDDANNYARAGDGVAEKIGNNSASVDGTSVQAAGGTANSTRPVVVRGGTFRLGTPGGDATKGGSITTATTGLLGTAKSAAAEMVERHAAISRLFQQRVIERLMAFDVSMLAPRDMADVFGFTLGGMRLARFKAGDRDGATADDP